MLGKVNIHFFIKLLTPFSASKAPLKNRHIIIHIQRNRDRLDSRRPSCFKLDQLRTPEVQHKGEEFMFGKISLMTLILTAALPQWAYSECGPLTVQYQFRAEHPNGVVATGFIDAIKPVVGNVTELGPALPADVLTKVKNADGINAIVGLPGVGGQLPSLLADTYNSGLPFYFTSQQHISWLLNHGGMELQQAQTDATVGPGLVVIPATLSASEHGLFFRTASLPDGVLPEDLTTALAIFDEADVRLFGNGGR